MYIILSFHLLACSDATSLLDGKEYLSWVKNPDNGLMLTKKLGGISYSAQYKPYDFIVLNEQKEYNLPKTIVENREKELKGMIYYNIRISTLDQTDILAKGVNDKSIYTQRLNYLSYDFQNNISLVTETDSVNCGLYHFVQTYGITPYIDMVVGFAAEQIATSQTLVIDDRVFGNGIIKFYIDKQDINNIPHLVTI